MSLTSQSPLKNFGFSYEYEGRHFAFHIVASSQQEAQARLSCMSGATLEGELHSCLSINTEIQLNRYQAMAREELVRLAGEQVLMKKETTELSAAQLRDIQALRNISLGINTGTDWHARGIELLNRIKERETTIAINHQRVSDAFSADRHLIARSIESLFSPPFSGLFFLE